jgi:hypothetical protein
MNKIIISLTILRTMLMACGGEVTKKGEANDSEKVVSEESNADELVQPEIVVSKLDNLPEGWVVAEILEADYLYVPDSVTQEEMSNLTDRYAKGFEDVYNYIMGQGLQPAGASMSMWITWEPTGYSQFQMGMPVSTVDAGNDIVKAGKIDAGPGIKYVHFGDYNDMDEPHIIINEWAVGADVTLGGPREVYATDAGMEPDTAKWQTEIWYPILND